jgi:hypothetical protein
MGAAVALAVVLAIVVAGASMAMESQRTAQPNRPRPQRPTRPVPDPVRRTPRTRDRGRSPEPPVVPDFPPANSPSEVPESKGPELLRTGKEAEARVISVVDERTIGPVTRSRLVLKIEPEGDTSVEVTVRHAFPTPEARGRVKVGGAVPVRYDPSDPNRVVIDLPRE